MSGWVRIREKEGKKEGDRVTRNKKTFSYGHRQVPAHYLTLTCNTTNSRKRLYWEHINAVLLIGEATVLHLFLTMLASWWKGRVQRGSWPRVSRSCWADTSRARTNRTHPHVILNLQHHPSEPRQVLPQTSDLNQKTSPVARDTYGHHSQEQLSSTSPAHFPLCDVRGCSVKRMTL